MPSKIVATAVETMLADIVTDGKEFAVRVVQQFEIHARHLIGTSGEVFQIVHPLLSSIATCIQFPAQLQQYLTQFLPVLFRPHVLDKFIEPQKPVLRFLRLITQAIGCVDLRPERAQTMARLVFQMHPKMLMRVDPRKVQMNLVTMIAAGLFKQFAPDLKFFGGSGNTVKRGRGFNELIQRLQQFKRFDAGIGQQFPRALARLFIRRRGGKILQHTQRYRARPSRTFALFQAEFRAVRAGRRAA